MVSPVAYAVRSAAGVITPRPAPGRLAGLGSRPGMAWCTPRATSAASTALTTSPGRKTSAAVPAWSRLRCSTIAIPAMPKAYSTTMPPMRLTAIALGQRSRRVEALGQPADHERRDGKADQEADTRSEEDPQPAPSAGQQGQPDRDQEQEDEHRRGAAPAAQHRAGEHHPEGLQGDRDGDPGDGDGRDQTEGGDDPDEDGDQGESGRGEGSEVGPEARWIGWVGVTHGIVRHPRRVERVTASRLDCRDECRADAGCRGRAAPDRPRELEPVGPRSPGALPVAGRQLLGRDPADHGRDQHRRRVRSRRAAERAGPAASRAGRGRRRRGPRHRLRGHGAALGVRRLRADRHRSLRPDAGAVPIAGRRAADLRAADPRRGVQPRSGGADHAAGGPAPPDPAGPVGQLALLERSGHRLLQHPDDHLAALAQCRRDRPDRVGPGVRGAARRPDQQRGHRRPQDGLLRRPAVRPRADPGAAGVRRVPDRRRRDPDRRAVPRSGPGGGARDRRGEAVRAVPRPDPPRRHLAGGPRRVDRRAARRQPAPPSDPGRAGGPGPAGPTATVPDRARTTSTRSSSWWRPPWRAATPPTGSAPPWPSAASWTTWSSSWSTRPRGPPEGLPAEVPELRTYRPRAGDEAVGLGHRPRPVYHDIIDHFRTIGPEGWRSGRGERATAGPTSTTSRSASSRRSAGSRSIWCRGR